MSIQEFTSVNSTNQKHCLVWYKYDNSMLFFGKVSRDKAKNHLASERNIECLRNFTTKIMDCKPMVNRGKKCASTNFGYVIMGVHPDRTSIGNREYVFCNHVNDEKNRTREDNRAHHKEVTIEYHSVHKFYSKGALHNG